MSTKKVENKSKFFFSKKVVEKFRKLRLNSNLIQIRQTKQIKSNQI